MLRRFRQWLHRPRNPPLFDFAEAFNSVPFGEYSELIGLYSEAKKKLKQMEAQMRSHYLVTVDEDGEIEVGFYNSEAECRNALIEKLSKTYPDLMAPVDDDDHLIEQWMTANDTNFEYKIGMVPA